MDVVANSLNFQIPRAYDSGVVIASWQSAKRNPLLLIHSSDIVLNERILQKGTCIIFFLCCLGFCQCACSRNDRAPLNTAPQTKHGKYEVRDMHFGTPHSRSGCLYQVSTMTVGGSMKPTFHHASPIVSERTNLKLADAFVGLLEEAAVAGDDAGTAASGGPPDVPGVPSLTAAARLTGALGGAPGLVVAALGVVGVAIHAGSVQVIKVGIRSNSPSTRNNLSRPPLDAPRRTPKTSGTRSTSGCSSLSPTPCWPILGISNILHGIPKPVAFNLVPSSFLLGNVTFVGLANWSKEVSRYLTTDNAPGPFRVPPPTRAPHRPHLDPSRNSSWALSTWRRSQPSWPTAGPDSTGRPASATSTYS